MRQKVVVAVAAVAAVALAPAAQAKTFTVTRSDDPAPGRCKPRDCSLREAVLAANSTARKDVIVLPRRKGAYVLQRQSARPENGSRSGDLDVLRPLAIVHRGKGRATIDAKRVDRILHVDAGGALELKRLVLRGGRTTTQDNDGGAILADGFLRAVQVDFRGNRAAHGGSGGAIDSDSAAGARIERCKFVGNRSTDNGGAINGDDDGLLTVKRSVFRNNYAKDDGGALDNGSMRIERSQFIANRADDEGGAIDYGGDEPLVITASTLRKNSAADRGGGIDLSSWPGTARILRSTFAENEAPRGGGLALGATSAEVTNSTFAENVATEVGGGMYVGEVVALTLNATTIARNSAGNLGGGIYSEPNSVTIVRNTILARNTAHPSNPDDGDCHLTGPDLLISGGHNLSTSWCELGWTGDQPGVANPGLGKLGKRGGPTPTVPLSEGSPAIDKADPATAPAQDQRGRQRGPSPDVGAFERGA